MFFAINQNIHDLALISKIKERTTQVKIKKIVNNLKNIAKDEIQKCSKLKIKIFKEESENEKKFEFKIAAPIIGLQQYIKEYKNHNSKTSVNKNNETEGENTPSTVDDNEEKQVDSSDFSDDE